MVGEALEGIGGKPLESDIIAKRIEFFKALGEHVQIIGDRKVQNASVQTTTTSDFYTVPINKFSFIFAIALNYRNISAGNQRTNVRIKGESPLLSIPLQSGQSETITLPLASPLIMKPTEVLRLDVSASSVNHEASVNVLLYEIDKQILF